MEWKVGRSEDDDIRRVVVVGGLGSPDATDTNGNGHGEKRENPPALLISFYPGQLRGRGSSVCFLFFFFLRFILYQCTVYQVKNSFINMCTRVGTTVLQY